MCVADSRMPETNLDNLVFSKSQPWPESWTRSSSEAVKKKDANIATEEDNFKMEVLLNSSHSEL